jgi:hypothetical protein
MSKFLQKYLMPTFAPETGTGGGDGGAAAAAAAAAASAGKPWHDGVEADTVGFWQNKGYKVDDPKALATDLTKQYRELERHIGAPPDQILRLPKADAKPEDIKAFWGKLGAPADAKEYDFSGIKFGGQDLDAGLADAMRAALASAFVPKDKGTAIVQQIVKHMEGAEAAKTAVTTAKIAEEKAQLAKDWGAELRLQPPQGHGGRAPARHHAGSGQGDGKPDRLSLRDGDDAQDRRRHQRGHVRRGRRQQAGRRITDHARGRAVPAERTDAGPGMGQAADGRRRAGDDRMALAAADDRRRGRVMSKEDDMSMTEQSAIEAPAAKKPAPKKRRNAARKPVQAAAPKALGDRAAIERLDRAKKWIMRQKD